MSNPGQDHRENTGKLANLQPPWTPGQSGNPGGRPKGRSLTAILRELMDRETDDGKTVAEQVVEAIAIHAIKGNAPMMKELWDRIDGKVKEVDTTPAVVIDQDAMTRANVIKEARRKRMADDEA